jgi:hypothetical protein
VARLVQRETSTAGCCSRPTKTAIQFLDYVLQRQRGAPDVDRLMVQGTARATVIGPSWNFDALGRR